MNVSRCSNANAIFRSRTWRRIVDSATSTSGISAWIRRQLPEKTRELKPSDARYGTYYLSANRLDYGEEESPALLLLWTREKDQWKVVAWAVEVP